MEYTVYLRESKYRFLRIGTIEEKRKGLQIKGRDWVTRAHTTFERRKIHETLHFYFGFLTFG